MSDHTEELWKVQNGYVVRSSGGRVNRFYSKATRERIASDHNACLGIESPETTVPELVEALATLADDCEGDLLNEWATADNPKPTTPALDRARAILAKTGQT